MKRLLLLTLLLLSVPGMAAPKYRVQVRNQFVGLICWVNCLCSPHKKVVRSWSMPK